MHDNIRFVSGADLCGAVDDILASSHWDNVFVLADSNTASLCLPLLDNTGLARACRIGIPCGDINKSLDTLSDIWMSLSCNRATRHSLLVNVGGGMVTDIGGFAASTFKRGMDYVNIPTTLLAMVDASTGGKTGINFNGLKNEIGVFNRPLTTLVCPSFLNTLPERECYSGYAEMLKHSLLSNTEEWARLVNLDEPCADLDSLLPEIERSVNVKRRITEVDPYEKGIRKALNFGHTAGHAFESFAMECGNPVPHGYAVAWGIICELFLSSVLKGFPTDIFRQTVTYIREHYGRLDFDCKQYDRLYSLMLHDKKNTSEGINFTLLSDIGSVETDNYVSRELIFESLDFYRDGL